VLKGLDALRKLGHHIALDNYLPQGCDPALLEVAEIVKINVSQAHAGELPRMVADLKQRNLKLIADDVETLEQFERCIGLGFAGFQGNFLQHPQTFRAQRIPTSRLGSLRLVTTLQNEDFSVDEVERLVAQDVAISFRVLRCINSSYYNLPRKVDSIRQAIVILGLDNLRQLCTLVALQGFDDRPPSLFVNAMTRARMCEQLGRLRGVKDVGPYFITGLFSMLNVLVGLPMQDVVKELPLAPAVTQALLEGTGDLGEALQCARAYERAAWKIASFEGISPQLIRAAYVDAVFWAEEARAQFAAA
jgi:EAL and modified HD-GYP domain-containing signal transduction protein